MCNLCRLSEEVPSSAVDPYEEINCMAETGEDRCTPHDLDTTISTEDAGVLSSGEQAVNALNAPASQPCGSMMDNPLYGMPGQDNTYHESVGIDFK